MPNRQIHISIVDSDWPRLKLIVNRDGQEVKTTVAPYDIAGSQFVPLVQDALKFAVDDVLKSHKVR